MRFPARAGWAKRAHHNAVIRQVQAFCPVSDLLGDADVTGAPLSWPASHVGLPAMIPEGGLVHRLRVQLSRHFNGLALSG